MRLLHLLPLSALIVGAAACGSVVALEEGPPRSVDAGSSVDSSSPTDAGSVDPTCPTTPVTLPAPYFYAAYTGGGRSVALGAGVLQPFVFSQAGVEPVADGVPAPGATVLYALPASSAFAVSGQFGGERSVRVFGEGFVEGPTVKVADTFSIDLRREGISSDGQVAHASSVDGAPAVDVHGSGTACVACDFVGAAGDALYVMRDGALERRRLTAASPGTDVVGRSPFPRDPQSEAPRLAGVAGRLLFLTEGERSLAVDRETLLEVPFAWEPGEFVTAVHDRRDGTFDIYSAGVELASASHRDGTGRVLSRTEGHAVAAYAAATRCGFWAGGTHYPFAR